MTTQAATPATEVQVEAYTNELLARLGVGPGASMEQLERAHDQRLDFLAQAPAEMAEWAQQEIGRVDEAYALLTDPHADIAAAAAAALAGRGQAASAPVEPAAPAGPPSPRMAHSTKVLLLIALAAAVIVGVYKMGGGSDVPGITGQPTDTAASAAPQLDTAKVSAAMEKIASNPKDVDALKELGDLYFAAGDYPTAIEWETKVLDVDPKDVTALLALGAAQFNSGDSKGAKANWQRVVRIEPRNAEAHYDLGFLALSVQPVDMATAKAEWQKVVDIDPTSDLAKSVSTHLDGLAKQNADAASK